jgi:DNA repair protein RecO (recombination protein O)
MPLVTTDAVILQAFPYSETSKILRLLTRSHGLCSTIARGALRPKSRYGGLLEPFSAGVATFYLKEGRELQTLSGFDLSWSGQGLGRDLVRFSAASLLAELALRAASEEPDPMLFERLRGALRRLERAAPELVEATGIAEAWAVTAQLGFAPSFECCVGCDRELDEGEESSFDYAAGGVRCQSCAEGRGGRSLPPHARQALVHLGRGEAVPLERTAAHWALLTRFLAYHLSDGGALRSLEFLTTILGQE